MRLLDGIGCPDDLVDEEPVVESVPNEVWLNGHTAAVGFVEKLKERRWRANTAPGRLESNE